MDGREARVPVCACLRVRDCVCVCVRARARVCVLSVSFVSLHGLMYCTEAKRLKRQYTYTVLYTPRKSVSIGRDFHPGGGAGSLCHVRCGASSRVELSGERWGGDDRKK